MKTRNPFVSGRFYPNDKNAITQFIKSNLEVIKKKDRAIAFIAPHAGYMFSGRSTLKLFEKNIIPNNIFILSPNHTAYGNRISIDSNERWKTPLGYINTNLAACNYLVNNSNYAKYSDEAQIFEHAVEVQLPFIQYFNSEASIIPITIAETNINILKDFAHTLLKCILNTGIDNSLIISSSDMTHFETSSKAEQQDELAITEILKLDANSLYNTVQENKISMCGVYPTTILLFALKELSKEINIIPKLINYTNSGETTGDYNDVVSYASIEFGLS